MKLQQNEIDQLFQSVCNRARTSIRQSQDAIVRQSRQRLKANGNDHTAWCVIAAASLAHQRPDRSLELLQDAPQLLKHDATGNRLAGYAALAQQQAVKAREFFDRAVRLDPHQPDCWNLLGKIAEEDNDTSQAVEYYERGLVFDDPSHVSALSLSQLQAKNNLLRDAIHTLRVCLMRDPRSPALNFSLAQLLERRALVLGRKQRAMAQQKIRQEALQCFKTVNASAPSERSLIGQARIQQQLFDYEGAKTSYQKAVQLAPHSSNALAQFAAANVDCGEMELAIQQFEKSISIDPSRAETHFQYTRAKKFKPCPETDRYIELLRECLGRNEQVIRPAIQLHFSLAKVLDDVGQHDQAWQHFDRANRLKQSKIKTRSKASKVPSEGASDDRSSSLPSTDVLKSFFTEEFFQDRKHLGNPSQTPVFIVGMPRSGTTLTEQILSSHRDIAGAGELTYLSQIRQELLRGAARQSGSPGIDHRRYPGVISDVSDLKLRQQADQYLARLARFGSGESRITDKMPTNFMHLGLIGLLFPGATVIHCRRNPLDVMVSCYCQNLNAPFCDLEQLVVYHRNYRDLMRHWEQSLPVKIHTVDYEDMVANPEPNARALVSHCGLSWDENCLNFHSSGRAVHTPSKWQVRQPMYKSSVEKWRRFEEQLRPVADQVNAELAAEANALTLESQFC